MELALQIQGPRYFVNPFIGKTARVTDEWLLQSIRLVAAQIADRKITADEFEDDGPYVGPSGIAYALLKTTRATNLDYTKQLDAILKAQNQYSPRVSDSHKCRYLCGTFGFHIIQLLAGHVDSASFAAQLKRLLGLVLQPGYQKIGDDDMLNGRAGFLAGLLTAKLEAGAQLLSDQEVGLVLSAMVKSGRDYSKKHRSEARLMYQWHDKEYLGAAHGLAGILQMLLSYWHFLDDSARADVKQSVDWLLSTQTADGNFPSSSHRIGEEGELVHWCHGASGALQMLLTAHSVLHEPKYLEAAQHCADLIWERGLLRKGPGICHGVAGNGYCFLLLHRHTGSGEYLDRAKAFAAVMMSQSFQNQARTPDRPWSLFEGWAGALCFLVDLLQPHRAQFPLVPIPFQN